MLQTNQRTIQPHSYRSHEGPEALDACGTCSIGRNYVRIHLQPNVSVDVEPAAFVAGMNYKTVTQSSTGWSLSDIFGRLTTNESLLTNSFALNGNHGWVIVAPPNQGDIGCYTFRNQADKIHLLSGSYLAGSNVQLSSATEDWSRSYSGIGTTTILGSPRVDGEAKIYFHADGASIIPLTIVPDNPITIDEKHIIGYAENPGKLTWERQLFTNSLLGAVGSGEDYVQRISGHGVVFLRSQMPPPKPQNSSSSPS